MKYPRIFVAGTFDGLHKGHEFFLSQAFSVGESVTIGLTSDQFVRKFKISPRKNSGQANFKLKIRGYDERKKDLERWLETQSYAKRCTIVPIHDPFEPAASYKEPFVLVVSTETRKRAEELNQIRKKRGLTIAKLIEVPMVNAQDGKPISSTRVRNGEIDPSGRLVLPDSLRYELSQPLGLVLHGEMINRSLKDHEGEAIITVGDVATKTLLDSGVTPLLIIIDNRVERKPYTGLAPWKNTILRRTAVVQSGPGYIAKKAIALIRKWAQQPAKLFVIEVDGEEDLLALPALIEAPIGSILYYGQPAVAAWACGPVVEGLVEVEVTEEAKKQAIALLRRFIQ